MSPHRRALHDLSDSFDVDQRAVGADVDETPAEARYEVVEQVFGHGLTVAAVIVVSIVVIVGVALYFMIAG